MLTPMKEYDGLVETIELLADQKSMRSLKRSLKQGQAGRWLSAEAVFGREGK